MLLEHARKELELLDEEPTVIDYYLETLESFVRFRGDQYSFFSGDFYTLLTLFTEACPYSPTEVVQTIGALLKLQPLSPLTDDPEEWLHHKDVVHEKGLGVWQNLRDPSAFSNDGGKTYRLLSEGYLTPYGAPVHKSEPHIKD